MRKRTIHFILMAGTLLLVFCGAARAQYVPVGRVASMSGNVVTIKGGSDVGFENGDILVVQRQGVKVALLQVFRVHATSSEAKIVNDDFGYSIQKGDEVAHELLRAGRSRTVSVYTADEYWEYPNEYLPSFVELFQEKMPPLPRSDLDYEIERQKRVLEQQPHSREAMVRLADSYFRKDWFELAIYWYQRAVQEQPRATDTDKLMYQIVRAYGALGRPDKQKMYMDYLRVNYPSSVFTTFNTQLDIIEPTVQLLPEWQRHPPKRVHMRRGGMRTLEKGGMQVMGDTVPGPVHGQPEKLDIPKKPTLLDVEEEEPEAEKKEKKSTKKKTSKKSSKKSKDKDEEECDARIVGIAGTVEVMLKSKKKKKWKTAELDQCLNKGDKVRTSAEGGAQIEYGKDGEDATVKLNADTTVTVGK